jgi:predicted DNA-binding protein
MVLLYSDRRPGELDELRRGTDELCRETERIIAESRRLMAQIEDRLEDMRQLRLAHDALLGQRGEQQKKT